MDKVFELLGLEKLDESVQTQIKDKLSDIIDIKAKELSESKLKEEKEVLIEEYEDKFEEYKNEITSKFSNFVDSVLEEELTIPENIVEYAHKGELYSELIEQFKIRLAIDEGILDTEVKGLLREAKDEIMTLKDQLNDKISIELEHENDLQEMAAALYVRKKCDGLTESQKTKVTSILEGITEKTDIDRKFDTIMETFYIDEVAGNKDKNASLASLVNSSNSKVATAAKALLKLIKAANPVMEGYDGEGISEVEMDEMNESNNPFDQYVNQYVDVLKENRI